MPERNLPAWNAMLSGLCHNAHVSETEKGSSPCSRKATGLSRSPSPRSWRRSSATTHWVQFCQRTRNWSTPSWPRRRTSTSPRERPARRSALLRGRVIKYMRMLLTTKKRCLSRLQPKLLSGCSMRKICYGTIVVSEDLGQGSMIPLPYGNIWQLSYSSYSVQFSVYIRGRDFLSSSCN
ncbi:uncharacterized protein LOC123430290 isoform X1 [Hordeum vulgare subsp. vulgare]|uniref:uncharacterized protein LOC123430290 isoform X1 n=2 Tax=Hordeum vulgare subsp. vulgare TaxID=112509 RepID=UPI001D1A374A|nr:uncharacterized protein LOC123430290 isoform X1 [Hordeum vulgare subsp. vulgare]